MPAILSPNSRARARARARARNRIYFPLILLIFMLLPSAIFSQSSPLPEAKRFDPGIGAELAPNTNRAQAEQSYLRFLDTNPPSAQQAAVYSRLGLLFSTSATLINEQPDPAKSKKYFEQSLAVEPRRVGVPTILARAKLAAMNDDRLLRYKANQGVYQWLVGLDDRTIEADLLPQEVGDRATEIASVKSLLAAVQQATGNALIADAAASHTPETLLDELRQRFPSTPLAAQVQAELARRNATERGPASTGYRIVGAGITGASLLLPESGKNKSRLEFSSSSDDLVKSFDWSKRQALSYARDEGDPVGLWIEGGEPGRESFCMRDMSHQAMGAHALGLSKHVHNMMRRFAENIAEERDWCSYWGMTRQNRPRRVDYRDNARFWYCLPANFDVLDCCFRMFLWSGNETYVRDPVFLNFYDRSVKDYVERWALAPEVIMSRPRLLNARGILDPNDKYQPNRGIPGYNEQEHTYTVGLDLVTKEYAAFLAYAHIQEIHGNERKANDYRQKALDLRRAVNEKFWNASENTFAARLDANHQPDGRAGSHLLMADMIDDDAKYRAAAESAGGYEALHRVGRHDEANAAMTETALGTRARREYPEVSYAWMGALVNGTMGIHVEAPSPMIAWYEGYWIETIVRTKSGLGTKIDWAELKNLPIRANEIEVRHDGMTKSAVSNLTGPALIWQACFDGEHETLLVNGRAMKATIETTRNGPLSSVRVTVGAGGMVAVEVQK